MSTARLTVGRPIGTVMATLIVVIVGGIALSRLPIDLMPDITYPTLTVSTVYENASPAEVEELIARPVEEALAAIPGVDQITSASTEGRADVRVTFTWGTDLDAAANDIRDRLDRIASVLPEESERPTLRKFDLASFPILILGAASELDPIQLRRVMEDQVQHRLERVPGVAAVEVSGGREREIHVDLDPDKVKALGIPTDVILERIREGNVTLPAGTIERGRYDVTVRTPGELENLDELADVVVAVRDGAPVVLRDIARIEDTTRRVTQLIRVEGRPGVRVNINKQAGTNTVEVARRVLEELEAVNRDIPQVRLTPIIDTSAYIERSITNVAGAAMWGGLLAIFVLFGFLRSVRSTLVIATAIPVSVIATFALIYFCGFTLNLMTLGGLALGVGMLVDNAIVVLENIFRRREEGEAAVSASIGGTGEVTPAIVASTLTTLVVFLPLIFVRGMSGVMFSQLAYVVSFSLLCSGVVSLTLVPMLTAKLLGMGEGQPRAARPGGLGARLRELLARPFEALEELYADVLEGALRHRIAVLGVTAAVFAGSLWLTRFIGQELMPTTDEGEVRVEAEMDVGVRVDVMDERFEAVNAIVEEKVPEMRTSVAYIGGTSWRAAGGHTAQLRIAMVPLAERERSSGEIATDLRRELARVPGMTIRTREGGGLFILRLASGGLERLSVEVRGHDLQTADALAAQVRELIEDVPGVTDARMTRESGTPEEIIVVDRRKAATLGVSVADIATALQTVLSGSSAGEYREAGDEHRILVKVAGSERMALRDILDFTVSSASGEPVVIRNVVGVESRRGPVRIERKDQERVVTVNVNVAGRDLGSIVGDIRERLRDVPRPPGFEIVFGGDYESQQEAFRELALAFVLALVLVYMVMACLYESLRDPFVVMFSVPVAAVGVVLILLLTDTTLNMQSFIGCIMLGGIVVNNAILLVDQTNTLREEGRATPVAIAEAGRRRLRPILMTALTTICGMLPMAIGWSEGGEAQAPLARAVIGGLGSSTLITLLVVPLVYSFIASERGARTRP